MISVQLPARLWAMDLNDSWWFKYLAILSDILDDASANDEHISRGLETTSFWGAFGWPVACGFWTFSQFGTIEKKDQTTWPKVGAKCHYFFCMSLISKNHWRVFTMFLQCLNQFGHGQDFQPQGRTKCRRLTGMQWCRQVLSAPASISMTGWNWMELDGDFDAQKHSSRHVSSTVL